MVERITSFPVTAHETDWDDDWIFTFSIAYHHLQRRVQLLEVVVQHLVVLLLLLKPLGCTQAHGTEYKPEKI